MNKLALALVLALGTANVSAAVEAKPVDTLENRIKSLNLSEEKKSAVMQLVSDHKIVTAAVGAVLLAGIAYGVDRQWNESKAWNAVVTFLGDWVKTPAVNGYNKVAGYVGSAKDGVVAHPYYTTAGVLVLAAAIFAAYDYRKEEDRSLLKKLYKKYVSKQTVVA